MPKIIFRLQLRYCLEKWSKRSIFPKSQYKTLSRPKIGHLTRKVGYFGLGGRKSEFLRRYPKMTFLLKSWILTIWGFQCVVNPIFSETLSVRNRLINPKLPKSCKNQIKFQVVLIWLRSLKSRF